MIKVSKNAKIITSLVLLVLAFLCSFSITSAYFTATASETGTLNFPNLDVRFITFDNNDDIPEDQLETATTQILLYPVGDSIPRGESFEFSLAENSDVPIKNLAIRNMSNSCEAYVRFWIDAYIVTGNVAGGTNYGQYFTLAPNANISRGGGAGLNASEKDWCYYVIYSMLTTSGYNTINLGNTLTISEDIPDAVLGSQLKITLTVEAVQAANNAFSSEFGDAEDVKGYYSQWGQQND